MTAQLLRPGEPTHVVTASSSFARKWLSPLVVIAVGGGLATAATSSAEPNRLWEEAQLVHERGATDSGLPARLLQAASTEPSGEATRQAVLELRRVSGLTWEQIGSLFKVSRRSLHSWASGSALNADNEEHLMSVLDVLRRADRGSARANRAALLEVSDGISASQLLAERRYLGALSQLGTGSGRVRSGPAARRSEAEDSRVIPHPVDLFDALDTVDRKNPKRTRIARTVRNSRRGSV